MQSTDHMAVKIKNKELFASCRICDEAPTASRSSEDSPARVLPQDILAHIARIIRLSVLYDMNENGVSFIANECAIEPSRTERSCLFLARAEIPRGTGRISQRTDSRQMLPEKSLRRIATFLRDTFDVSRDERSILFKSLLRSISSKSLRIRVYNRIFFVWNRFD